MLSNGYFLLLIAAFSCHYKKSLNQLNNCFLLFSLFDFLWLFSKRAELDIYDFQHKQLFITICKDFIFLLFCAKFQFPAVLSDKKGFVSKIAYIESRIQTRNHQKLFLSVLLIYWHSCHIKYMEKVFSFFNKELMEFMALFERHMCAELAAMSGLSNQ
jgi:hypothetical protein